MRRLFSAGLAFAVSIAALVGTSPTQSMAGGYVVKAGPRFNLPLSARGVSGVKVTTDSDSNQELNQHLVELINNTAGGAEIRISLYGWDDWSGSSAPNPTPALQNALSRGVKVKILLDAGAKLSADYTTLKNAMIGRSGSYIKRCGVGYQTTAGSGRGCLGSAVNHSKVFLFSRVGLSDYVVVQGTSHITPTWGNGAWDAMMTVVGRKKLYDGYVKYFEDEAKNVRQPNYYRTVTDGAYKAYFFPRTVTKTSDDVMVGILNNVKCSGNTTRPSASGHATKIRIATYNFTREKVAAKIQSLAKQGCYFDIAVNGENMGSKVKTYLKSKDSPSAAKRINVDNAHVGNMIVHAKYMLIEGNYDGHPNSTIMWVGSPNLTNPALDENDESLLKIESKTGAWFDQWADNFRNIMKVSPDAW